jgi:heme/copper-type cytochrome/quinol oxidase subunit 1
MVAQRGCLPARSCVPPRPADTRIDLDNVAYVLGSRLPRWLLVGALICLAIAFVNRHSYPSRSIEVPHSGWTAYAPVDEPALGRFERLDVWDPYLWLGAGVALLVTGCAVGATARRRRT